MVGHMMLDASGLQHARSGDDDSRFGVEIELLGFLDGMDISQRVETKRVGVCPKCFLHIFAQFG